jgi:hypothetical protein
MKTSFQTGANDYMIISGKSDGNTYVSARNGSNLYLRGGGNDSGNEIIVYNSGFTDRIDFDTTTAYFNGNVGIGTASPDAFTKLTVAGAMTLTGQNTGHGASRIKIGQDTSAISQIRFYGADASTRGILQFIGSSSDGAVGTESMRIHSNGNVGIGTTSPVSLLHLENASSPTLRIKDTTNNVTLLAYAQNSDAHIGTYSNHDLIFDANSTEAMRINSSGSVDFADTVTISDNVAGTFQALVLNNSRSSQDEVGNVSKLSFQHNSVNAGEIRSVTTEDFTTSANRSADLSFHTIHNGTLSERLRINDDGNVGIGTTSPDTNLHIYDASGGATLKVASNTANAYDSSKIQMIGGNLSTSEILLGDASDSDIGRIIYRHNGNSLAFDVNAEERMRIDSSGNVLVGKTGVGFANLGCELRANGQITGTRDESASLILNRTTSDGNIAQFYKDGTQAGLIGTIAGFLYVGSNNNTALTFVSNAIRPSRDDGSGRDNVIDLGQSGNRFNDLYLGGSVYLGGTGSANALDDYEEGTFTPTIHAGASNITAHSNNYGKYTKIGNVVHCSGRFQSTSLTAGSSSTNVELGGLPFSAVVSGLSSGTGCIAGSIGFASGFSGEAPTAMQIRNNEPNAFLYFQNEFLGFSNLKGNDLGSATTIVFQITYQTS